MKLLEGFIVRLQRDKRPSSVSRYRYDLEYFEDFLKRKKMLFELKTFLNLKEEDYQEFFEYLKTNKKLSDTTIKRIMSVLNSFIEFIECSNNVSLVFPAIPSDELSEKSKIDFDKLITKEEVEKILENIENEKLLEGKEVLYAPFIKNRNKAIIRLLFENGLKVSELVLIDMKDLNLYKKEIVIKSRKGNRIIKISDSLRDDIIQYLGQIPKIIRPMFHSNQPLFVAFDAVRETYRWDYELDEPKRISARQIQKILKRESEKNDIPHFNARNLRNSRIHYTIEEFSKETVMQIFGINSKSTLSRFVIT